MRGKVGSLNASAAAAIALYEAARQRGESDQARSCLDKAGSVLYKTPLRRRGRVSLAPGGQSRNFWGFAGVAQLAEQLPCKQQVAGSNPTASSSWLVASIVVVRGSKWSRRGSRAAKGSRL